MAAFNHEFDASSSNNHYAQVPRRTSSLLPTDLGIPTSTSMQGTALHAIQEEESELLYPPLPDTPAEPRYLEDAILSPRELTREEVVSPLRLNPVEPALMAALLNGDFGPHELGEIQFTNRISSVPWGTFGRNELDEVQTTNRMAFTHNRAFEVDEYQESQFSNSVSSFHNRESGFHDQPDIHTPLRMANLHNRQIWRDGQDEIQHPNRMSSFHSMAFGPQEDDVFHQYPQRLSSAETVPDLAEAGAHRRHSSVTITGSYSDEDHETEGYENIQADQRYIRRNTTIWGEDLSDRVRSDLAEGLPLLSSDMSDTESTAVPVAELLGERISEPTHSPRESPASGYLPSDEMALPEDDWPTSNFPHNNSVPNFEIHVTPSTESLQSLTDSRRIELEDSVATMFYNGPPRHVPSQPQYLTTSQESIAFIPIYLMHPAEARKPPTGRERAASELPASTLQNLQEIDQDGFARSSFSRRARANSELPQSTLGNAQVVQIFARPSTSAQRHEVLEDDHTFARFAGNPALLDGVSRVKLAVTNFTDEDSHSSTENSDGDEEGGEGASTRMGLDHDPMTGYGNQDPRPSQAVAVYASRAVPTQIQIYQNANGSSNILAVGNEVDPQPAEILEGMSEASTLPADEDGFHGPRYAFMKYHDLEEIEDYKPGGYHPIHLKDVLNDRYTIVHKLGYGKDSVVWLAHDYQWYSYVAIKIIKAASSIAAFNGEYEMLRYLKRSGKFEKSLIDFPKEYFWLKGNNGRHLCIVFPIGGPSIAQLTKAGTGLDAGQVRRASLQITQCLALLHAQGVAHGDISSANVLLQPVNIAQCTVDEIYLVYGSIVREKVITLSGKPEPSAPRYLVRSADVANIPPSYLTGNIRLIDFGESFHSSKLNPRSELPVTCFPPELWISKEIGKESDIWALGCLIFEMRARQSLFEVRYNSIREFLVEMVEILGQLPADLEQLFAGEIDDAGGLALRERILNIDEKREMAEPNANGRESGSRFQRGIRRFWSLSKKRPVGDPNDAKGSAIRKSAMQGRVMISEQEAESLYDMLRQVLNYVVEERMTAEKMLTHPWFSVSF